MSGSNKFHVFAIAALAVIIDQLSKILIRVYLPEGDYIPVIENFLQITHTENTGAAFSLFSGQIGILTVISIIAVIIISYLIIQYQNEFKTWDKIAWGLFLGGTAGNLIDRLMFSKVTDFIDFIVINFPVFNIADICIDTGAVLIVIISLFGAKKKNNEPRSH